MLGRVLQVGFLSVVLTIASSSSAWSQTTGTGATGPIVCSANTPCTVPPPGGSGGTSGIGGCIPVGTTGPTAADGRVICADGGVPGPRESAGGAGKGTGARYGVRGKSRSAAGPTADAVDPPGGGSAQPANDSGVLPFTGFGLMILAALAAGLIASGLEAKRRAGA
jgi:hypothetical protein